jgi:lycopene beta-cyclase
MRDYDYILTGAGASGLMLAYRMANDPFFSEKSILIIDPEKRKDEDRTWCFWEVGRGEWDEIVSKFWESIYVAGGSFTKSIPIEPYTYKMILSSDFYEKIWTVLNAKDNIQFLHESVTKIEPTEEGVHVQTNQGNYHTSKVFNSIPGYSNYNIQKKYPVLQQHFVGWFIKTKKPSFDASTATFMDFNIPQEESTRFMYVLPTSKTEALFEYTLFSEKLLSKDAYESGIKDYLKKQGIEDYTITRKEQGAIPMTAYPFRNNNSKNILHIGTNGGWTKASTGYTFYNCTKKTKNLADFLKKYSDLRHFDRRTKFNNYDLLFLDVLAQNNARGGELFTRLFNKTKVKTLLKFLDESTNLFEDISIMLAVPPRLFTQTLMKRILLFFRFKTKRHE